MRYQAAAEAARRTAYRGGAWQPIKQEVKALMHRTHRNATAGRAPPRGGVRRARRRKTGPQEDRRMGRRASAKKTKPGATNALEPRVKG